MEIKKTQKIPEIFSCELCAFTTCHKNDYKKHLMTPKHKNLEFGNKKTQKNPKNPELYYCNNCLKKYITNSGLWKHTQKCYSKNDSQQINNTFLKEEVLTKNLLYENKDLKQFITEQTNEFKNLIVEICKNMQPNITSNTSNTINSHNKTFNLQVFLNETCKDAMNIMDFIDSIKIQLEDLEDVGKLGYINGISNIIMKNLKALDVSQRPVHCSDSKRETLYVKDQDKWEKEDEANSRLRKAIRRIAYKNTKIIRDWRDIHPDHDNSFSKTSDIYQQIVIESMGGKYYETMDTEAKIIKNIAKHVVIDK